MSAAKRELTNERRRLTLHAQPATDARSDQVAAVANEQRNSKARVWWTTGCGRRSHLSRVGRVGQRGLLQAQQHRKQRDEGSQKTGFGPGLNQRGSMLDDRQRELAAVVCGLHKRCSTGSCARRFAAANRMYLALYVAQVARTARHSGGDQHRNRQQACKELSVHGSEHVPRQPSYCIEANPPLGCVRGTAGWHGLCPRGDGRNAACPMQIPETVELAAM